MKYQTVKCSVRLPEEKTPVFVLDDDNNQHTAFYQDGHWYESWGEDVIAKPTYWLEPLPQDTSEPTKETEDSKSFKVKAKVKSVEKASFETVIDQPTHGVEPTKATEGAEDWLKKNHTGWLLLKKDDKFKLINLLNQFASSQRPNGGECKGSAENILIDMFGDKRKYTLYKQPLIDLMNLYAGSIMKEELSEAFKRGVSFSKSSQQNKAPTKATPTASIESEQGKEYKDKCSGCGNDDWSSIGLICDNGLHEFSVCRICGMTIFPSEMYVNNSPDQSKSTNK